MPTTAESTLMLDTPGSRYVTLAELRTLPEPPRTGPYHRPVPHAQFVEELLMSCDARNWQPSRVQLGINRDGSKLFGTIDLKTRVWDDGAELGTALGFRSSTNSSLAIKATAGARVFVCSNMAMSGEEFVMHRKSTTNIVVRDVVDNGLNQYLSRCKSFKRQIEALQNMALSLDEAKAQIYDLFAQKVLPPALFHAVSLNYFDVDTVERPDCAPNTRWGLNNACTRAIQQRRPHAQYDQARRIGAHFFGNTHSAPLTSRFVNIVDGDTVTIDLGDMEPAE